MSQIFISYSHDDSEYAHKLEDALGQRGFKVWIDDRIYYGQTWPQVIQKELDASAAVIVIMTPRAYKSPYVHSEVARAQRKGKPVFPLLLEGECWLPMEAILYVDVQNGTLPPSQFYDRLGQYVSERARIILEPIHGLELEMILIPAGKFLIGSDVKVDKKAFEDECPQHDLDLSDYYLAQIPVTNAQYLVFVRETGQEAPGHWQNGKLPPDKEDHPVVHVSWDDANAFCRWLASVTGKSYRLPSEAEWEKGARGTDGRIYPWGNEWDAERANTKESLVEDTTPVDAYPKGASPYDLLDMVGNVREWTLSLRRSYPYNAQDGREDLLAEDAAYRVLRGGSYHLDKSAARCALRNWDIPDWRSPYCGFRVCMVP